MRLQYLFVGYAEILSALSRKKRDNDLTEKDFKILLRAFEDDWESFILVEVSAALNAKVKQILLDFPLRHFHTVHRVSFPETCSAVVSGPD